MEPCNCCQKPAAYFLSNTHQLKCCRCKNIKYKIGDIKLNLCDLQCDNLYWTLEKEISSDPANMKVVYCLEKDECDHCGQRDWPSVTFSGTSTKINRKCNFCPDNTRYELTNIDDIICPKCKVIVYPENEYNINLYSTKCNQLPWTVEEYLTELDSNHTQLVYRLNNFKCTECNKKSDDIVAMFEGSYVGKKSSNNKRIPKQYSNRYMY